VWSTVAFASGCLEDLLDVGDHVVAAGDHDLVADREVRLADSSRQGVDVVDVVQARLADVRPGEVHRVEVRHGGQAAGLAHLPADGPQDRGLLRVGELQGDRALGAHVAAAHRLAVVPVVHVHDQPVDLPVERVPLAGDVLVEDRDDLVHRRRHVVRRDHEAHAAEGRHLDALRLLRHAVREVLVGDDRQVLRFLVPRLALGRARRRVAGVRLAGEVGCELRLAADDLASDVPVLRLARRKLPDGTLHEQHVAGDVLALVAVASGDRLDQLPVPVDQVDADAVELVRDAGGLAGPPAAKVAVPVAHVGVELALVQRPHRDRVSRLRPPARPRSRTDRRQDGVARVKLDQLVPQRVVGRVRHDRGGLVVVGLVRRLDAGCEVCDSGGVAHRVSVRTRGPTYYPRGGWLEPRRRDQRAMRRSR